MNDVLIRFLLTAGIILAGIAAYQLVTRAVLSKARSANRRTPMSRTHTPAILYFTTPDCVPCKTIQRPALQKVKETVGDRVDVVEVDAYEKPDLARQWGVLSVPTTFILDANGVPRHVNHGATPAARLLKQMEDII
jgi:thioredoxin-like negative regulator of GroEL